MTEKGRIRFGFLLSLACLVLSALVLSHASASNKLVEFDHTTVHVRDLQKSAEFYQKAFGLEKISEPFKDGKHVWFRVGAHQQLHVVGGATEVVPQEIDVHFAFRVASLPDLMARLDQMQVKYRNFNGDGKVTDRPDGVRQLYLQDPDGYWIEVNDNKF